MDGPGRWSWARRIGRLGFVVAVLTSLSMAGTLGASVVQAAGQPTLKNKHLTFVFDPTDPERVTNLTWKDSGGTTSGNYVAEGGPAWCTDPQEWFGQSYGAPEGTTPYPVIGGHLATFKKMGKMHGTITAGPLDCFSGAQLPVTTKYVLYKGSGPASNEVQISRTFGFDKHSGMFTGAGLRPYVPRVSLGTFSTVIYPNGADTATTSALAGSCGGDCFVPPGASWDGRWLADIDPSNGYALIILRDPSMTSSVDFTVNSDSFSSSNLSSFVLIQPASGWTKSTKEIEYLCFADLTSWPQAARDAAQLPAGCGPPA